MIRMDHRAGLRLTSTCFAGRAQTWAKQNPNVGRWVVQMTKFMLTELLLVADEYKLTSPVAPVASSPEAGEGSDGE